jgi:hypothetical protein
MSPEARLVPPKETPVFIYKRPLLSVLAGLAVALAPLFLGL